VTFTSETIEPKRAEQIGLRKEKLRKKRDWRRNTRLFKFSAAFETGGQFLRPERDARSAERVEKIHPCGRPGPLLMREGIASEVPDIRESIALCRRSIGPALI